MIFYDVSLDELFEEQLRTLFHGKIYYRRVKFTLIPMIRFICVGNPLRTGSWRSFQTPWWFDIDDTHIYMYIRVTWTINVRIGAEITIEREFLDSLFRAPIFLLTLSLLSFLLFLTIDIQRTEPQFLWLRPSLLRGRYNHLATRNNACTPQNRGGGQGGEGRDDEEEEDEGDEGSGRERHWHGAERGINDPFLHWYFRYLLQIIACFTGREYARRTCDFLPFDPLDFFEFVFSEYASSCTLVLLDCSPLRVWQN